MNFGRLAKLPGKLGKTNMAFGNIYNGKKVLVTGHTGFKGSWLCQWLLDLGATVAGYSSDIPTQPSNFEILKLSTKIKDYRNDVRDLQTALGSAV